MPQMRVEVGRIVRLVVDGRDREPAALRSGSTRVRCRHTRIGERSHLDDVNAQRAVRASTAAGGLGCIAVVATPGNGPKQGAAGKPDSNKRSGIWRIGGEVRNPTMRVAIETIIHIGDKMHTEIQLAAAESRRAA